jgi:hypothetical protein
MIGIHFVKNEHYSHALSTYLFSADAGILS